MWLLCTYITTGILIFQKYFSDRQKKKVIIRQVKLKIFFIYLTEKNKIKNK